MTSNNDDTIRQTRNWLKNFDQFQFEQIELPKDGVGFVSNADDQYNVLDAMVSSNVVVPELTAVVLALETDGGFDAAAPLVKVSDYGKTDFGSHNPDEYTDKFYEKQEAYVASQSNADSNGADSSNEPADSEDTGEDVTDGFGDIQEMYRPEADDDTSVTNTDETGGSHRYTARRDRKDDSDRVSDNDVLAQFIDELIPDDITDDIDYAVAYSLSPEEYNELPQETQLLLTTLERNSNTVLHQSLIDAQNAGDFLTREGVIEEKQGLVQEARENSADYVRNYVNAERDFAELHDDLDSQITAINAEYSAAENEWLEKQIERLREEYRKTHPNRSQEVIDTLIEEHADEIEELTARLNKTQDGLTQSLTRFLRVGTPQQSALATIIVTRQAFERAQESLDADVDSFVAIAAARREEEEARRRAEDEEALRRAEEEEARRQAELEEARRELEEKYNREHAAAQQEPDNGVGRHALNDDDSAPVEENDADDAVTIESGSTSLSEASGLFTNGETLTASLSDSEGDEGTGSTIVDLSSEDDDDDAGEETDDDPFAGFDEDDDEGDMYSLDPSEDADEVPFDEEAEEVESGENEPDTDDEKEIMNLSEIENEAVEDKEATGEKLTRGQWVKVGLGVVGFAAAMSFLGWVWPGFLNSDDGGQGGDAAATSTVQLPLTEDGKIAHDVNNQFSLGDTMRVVTANNQIQNVTITEFLPEGGAIAVDANNTESKLTQNQLDNWARRNPDSVTAPQDEENAGAPADMSESAGGDESE